MKSPVDPPRIMDSADADPVLRHALRVIHEDVPSLAALGALADGAERALQASTVAKGAASSLVAKIGLVTVAGGAVAAGLYFGAPSSTRLVAPSSSHATTLAPESAPTSRAATGARGAGTSKLDAPVSPDTEPAPVPARPEDAPATIPEHGAHSAETHGAAPVPRATGDASSRPGQAAPGSSPSANAIPNAREEQPRKEERKPARKLDEVELLESAQQSLSGNPRHALELLAEHRKTYPGGKFAQERDVMMLEAYKRLRDGAALREGARAFLARYPRSPYRARVNKLLE